MDDNTEIVADLETTKMIVESPEFAKSVNDVTAGRGRVFNPNAPKPFRIKLPEGEKSAYGKRGDYRYGCYFPSSDLCVTEGGGRGTGEPKDVEWLDEI